MTAWSVKEEGLDDAEMTLTRTKQKIDAAAFKAFTAGSQVFRSALTSSNGRVASRVNIAKDSMKIVAKASKPVLDRADERAREAIEEGLRDAAQ